MAKLTEGMPSSNSRGNSQSDYTLIQILLKQVQAMNFSIVEVTEDSVAIDGGIHLIRTGASVLTLPLASESKGMEVIVINIDGAPVTVLPTGTDTINGQAIGFDMDSAYDKIHLICIGSEWIQLFTQIA